MRRFKAAVAFLFALTATSTAVLVALTITDPPGSPVLLAARLAVVTLVALGWVRIAQSLRRLNQLTALPLSPIDVAADPPRTGSCIR